MPQSYFDELVTQKTKKMQLLTLYFYWNTMLYYWVKYLYKKMNGKVFFLYLTYNLSFDFPL